MYTQVCLFVTARFISLIITEPSTGSLKIPVMTGTPFQTTSRGVPTFTEAIFMVSDMLTF